MPGPIRTVAGQLKTLGFTNFWPIDEGSGTSIVDHIGSNTGTTLASNTWVSDSWLTGPTCLDFSKVASSGISHSNISLTAAFTAFACIKIDTFDGMVFGNTADGDTYIFDTLNATTLRSQSDNVATFKDYTVPTMTAGTWYTVGLTRSSGNSVRTFLNGIESSSGAQSIVGTFTINEIGRYSSGGFPAQNHDGRIAGAALASGVELTQAQMKQTHQIVLRAGVSY